METKSSGINKYRSGAELLLRLCCLGVMLGPAHAETPCCVRELYKYDGWIIPGIAGAVVSGSRVVERDGASILVETLKPQFAESSFTMFNCVADVPGRIVIHEQAVDTLNIVRYSAQGKVFAYRISAGEVAIEGSTRVALGAAHILMYYDTEGDGLFELREYGTPIPYRLRIPDWAKVHTGER